MALYHVLESIPVCLLHNGILCSEHACLVASWLMHIASVNLTSSYWHKRGVIVWSSIGYTFRSLLVCIVGNLNSAHYITFVLTLAALHFIRTLQNDTIQQDTTRLYVTGIVQIFLYTENAVDAALECLYCGSVINITRKIGNLKIERE